MTLSFLQKLKPKCFLQNLEKTWRTTKTPTCLGKNIYSNPIFSKRSFVVVGYHATRLSMMGSQIDFGRFDNQNSDIYFSKKILGASQYLRKKKDAVILKIGSNNRKKKDYYFKKDYFPRGPDQRVYILEAYEIHPFWREIMDDPSLYYKYSFIARIVTTVFTALHHTYFQQVKELKS